MPSDLPIVTPDPPARKTQGEKYGGLYYLGIGGLIVLVALVAWFAVGVWNLRGVWRDVYILHDSARPEADRIQAAFRLSRDPRATQQQFWDIALRKSQPPLARYLLGEALTEEIVAPNPRAYAQAVAYSAGWPEWLRLLFLRPAVDAAADGFSLPAEPFSALRRDSDPAIALYAAATLAALNGEKDADAVEARAFLSRTAGQGGPYSELARLLLEASRMRASDDRGARVRILDRATQWLREHHPAARRVWDGWAVEGDRLVRHPALEMRQNSAR